MDKASGYIFGLFHLQHEKWFSLSSGLLSFCPYGDVSQGSRSPPMERASISFARKKSDEKIHFDHDQIQI
jgi:hypothetical protein